jgi:hypothetical protein
VFLGALVLVVVVHLAADVLTGLPVPVATITAQAAVSAPYLRWKQAWRLAGGGKDPRGDARHERCAWQLDEPTSESMPAQTKPYPPLKRSSRGFHGLLGSIGPSQYFPNLKGNRAAILASYLRAGCGVGAAAAAEGGTASRACAS